MTGNYQSLGDAGSRDEKKSEESTGSVWGKGPVSNDCCKRPRLEGGTTRETSNENPGDASKRARRECGGAGLHAGGHNQISKGKSRSRGDEGIKPLEVEQVSQEGWYRGGGLLGRATGRCAYRGLITRSIMC